MTRRLPLFAVLAAGLLGLGCASEPLTREEADYPEHLVIPPDLVGPPPPPEERERPQVDDDEALPVDVARTIPSRLIERDGEHRLELDMGVNDAWRGTGAALDRLDFTVLERQRDDLRYVIRYEPRADQEIQQPGFFARVFRGEERIDTSPQRYRIQLETDGGQVLVRVLDADGEPAPEQVARRLLTLLDRQLY